MIYSISIDYFRSEMRFTQPPPSCATPLSANEILVPAKTEPVIVEDKLTEVNINYIEFY